MFTAIFSTGAIDIYGVHLRSTFDIGGNKLTNFNFLLVINYSQKYVHKKSADKKTYSTWWNFGPKSRWAGTSNTIELTFKFYFCINFEMNRMMFRGLLFYLVVRK